MKEFSDSLVTYEINPEEEDFSILELIDSESINLSRRQYFTQNENQEDPIEN